MKMIKRAIASLARRAGYAVIPNWRMDAYPHAIHVAKLLRLAEVDLVIDVGANAGQFHSFLRSHVGYSGSVLSFEPIPWLADQMRSNGDLAWQIEACALGASEETADLRVMAADRFSSFLTPDHSSTARFRASNRVVRTLTVPVRKLDVLSGELDSIREAKSIYLKLDTQGTEIEILKGAITTLQKVAVLQVELSFRQIYLGSPRYDEAIRFVESLGYSLSGLYPNNSEHFPSMLECDGLFLAKGLAAK